MPNETLPEQRKKKRRKKKKKAGKQGGNQVQQQHNAVERRNDGGIAGGNVEGDTAIEEVSTSTQQNEGGIRESNTPYQK
jgi:hypothetical protein